MNKKWRVPQVKLTQLFLLSHSTAIALATKKKNMENEVRTFLKSPSVIGVFICTLEHVNVQSFPKVRFSDFYDWLVHSLLCEMSQVCFLGVTSDRNGITIKSESGYNLKIVCTKEARSGHLKKPFSYFLSLSCHFLPELWLRRHDHWSVDYCRYQVLALQPRPTLARPRDLPQVAAKP